MKSISRAPPTVIRGTADSVGSDSIHVGNIVSLRGSNTIRKKERKLLMATAESHRIKAAVPFMTTGVTI